MKTKDSARFYVCATATENPVTETQLPATSHIIQDLARRGPNNGPVNISAIDRGFLNHGDIYREWEKEVKAQGPGVCIVERARKVAAMSAGRRKALSYIAECFHSITHDLTRPKKRKHKVSVWKSPSMYSSAGVTAALKNGMRALGRDGLVHTHGRESYGPGYEADLFIGGLTEAGVQMAWVNANFTDPMYRVLDSVDQLAKKVGANPVTKAYVISIARKMLLKAEMGRTFLQCRCLTVRMHSSPRSSTPAIVGLERRGLLRLDRDSKSDTSFSVCVPPDATVVKVALKLDPSLIEKFLVYGGGWGTV